MDSIVVGRIPVHLFSVATLHETILATCRGGQKKTVLNSNAHLVQLANSREKWLVDYFRNEVDYVMCDGSGIQLGAKLTGQKVPLKIAYNIWFWDFAKFCEQNNLSIFLLGSKETVGKKAMCNLMAKNPGLKIAHHHGYYDKKTESEENKNVLRIIKEFKPDILLVCFGMPFQEKYIRENFGRLVAHVIMSGGGALDFFSGESKTAPAIFRRTYLEWLYRLVSDPLRLWKRYLIGNFRFLYYTYKYRHDRGA